jgi:hypothetical protein
MLILIDLIIWPLGTYIIIAFSTGFISHLILDSLSKEGLNFLFFGRLKGPIKVGGFYENLFFALIFVLLVLLIIRV